MAVKYCSSASIFIHTVSVLRNWSILSDNIPIPDHNIVENNSITAYAVVQYILRHIRHPNKILFCRLSEPFLAVPLRKKIHAIYSVSSEL